MTGRLNTSLSAFTFLARHPTHSSAKNFFAPLAYIYGNLDSPSRNHAGVEFNFLRSSFDNIRYNTLLCLRFQHFGRWDLITLKAPVIDHSFLLDVQQNDNDDEDETDEDDEEAGSDVSDGGDLQVRYDTQ